MLEEFEKMYNSLSKYLEREELTYCQRELAGNAKNAVKLLIAMEEN